MDEDFLKDIKDESNGLDEELVDNKKKIDPLEDAESIEELAEEEEDDEEPFDDINPI